LVLETANALATLKLMSHKPLLAVAFKTNNVQFDFTRISERSLFCCTSKTWNESTV